MASSPSDNTDTTTLGDVDTVPTPFEHDPVSHYFGDSTECTRGSGNTAASGQERQRAHSHLLSHLRRNHTHNRPRPMQREDSQPAQDLPLGWAESGYYNENPWFGEAAEKPIFSLGKPLPHRVRHRRTESRTEQRPNNDIEQGRVDGEHRAAPSRPTHNLDSSMYTSCRPCHTRTRTRTNESTAARDVQRDQERTTAAGVAHSDKRNDAGQPVFDYIPGDTNSPPSHTHHDHHPSAARNPTNFSHQSSNDTVAQKKSEQPKYKVDGEPLGKTEQPEVEQGQRSPDELRNWWARVRARHPEPLAEFLSTSVGIFLGLASTLSVNLSAKNPDSTATYGNYETTCWAWGFAWMFGIYLGGGVSGAHMNPAISISLSLFRGFPWRQCAVYVAAQFLASLAAGGLAYAVYADTIHHLDPSLEGMSQTFFSTPQEWVSMPSAFLNQVVGGAVMTIAVFALGDDQNNPPGAGMHALVLGLLVTTLKFALGYNIGSALNPASDFGPRVIAYAVGYREWHVFGSLWWLYGPWLATLLGSVLGCVVYDGCVFVGSESPVNYRMSKPLKARLGTFSRSMKRSEK